LSDLLGQGVDGALLLVKVWRAVECVAAEGIFKEPEESTRPLKVSLVNPLGSTELSLNSRHLIAEVKDSAPDGNLGLMQVLRSPAFMPNYYLADELRVEAAYPAPPTVKPRR
jgi:hypothetical protein